MKEKVPCIQGFTYLLYRLCISFIVFSKIYNSDRLSCNILTIYFQFLVGRLLDFVTDVAFSERLLVVSYLESRITVVTFGKKLEFPGSPSSSYFPSASTSTNTSGCNFENIVQCDPKIYVLDLLGPPARR